MALVHLASGVGAAWFLSDLDYEFAPNQTCHQLADCFNCTLSNCEWSGKGCSGNAPTSPSTLWYFFRTAQSCGDPLNLCRTQALKADETEDFDREVYSYNPQKVGTFIPKGYFCVRPFENPWFNSYPMMYWNRSNSFDEDNRELLLFHNYFLQATDDKGRRHYDNEWLTNNELQGWASNSLNLFLTDSYMIRCETAWVNLVSRELTADDLGFQIVLLQAGLWAKTSAWFVIYGTSTLIFLVFTVAFGFMVRRIHKAATERPRYLDLRDEERRNAPSLSSSPARPPPQSASQR